MNKENMAHIIADPTALAVLQRCASVNELVARLNWAGAECTREEGLRFLRTWEKLAAESECIEDAGVDMAAGGAGIIDAVKSMLGRDVSRKNKLMPGVNPNQLTIEMILNQMNK